MIMQLQLVFLFTGVPNVPECDATDGNASIAAGDSKESFKRSFLFRWKMRLRSHLLSHRQRALMNYLSQQSVLLRSL